MGIDIESFRAVVDSGFLKPTHYRIMFPLPSVIQSMNNGSDLGIVNETLSYFADSVDLPGIGSLTHNICRYGYGPTEKKVFASSFNDIVISFYNDSNGDSLAFFQNWMQQIINFNYAQFGITSTSNYDTYEIRYKDDYVVDAQITLIDDNGNDVVTYCTRRMFPVQISETKLAFAAVQDIMRITVVFSYIDLYVLNNGSSSGTSQFLNQSLNNTSQSIPEFSTGLGAGPTQTPTDST